MAKKRQETIGKIKKRCWELCRKIVIIRDESTCQWCGKRVEKTNRHVSHVIPKSAGNILSCDPTNLKILCYHCHINRWHKDPLAAWSWFSEKFPERATYLQQKKNSIVKWGIEDWKDIESNLKSRLEDLHGNRA